MIIFTSTVGCCLVFLCYMHIVFVFFLIYCFAQVLLLGVVPARGAATMEICRSKSGVPGFHM